MERDGNDIANHRKLDSIATEIGKLNSKLDENRRHIDQIEMQLGESNRRSERMEGDSQRLGAIFKVIDYAFDRAERALDKFADTFEWERQTTNKIRTRGRQ